MTEMNAKVKLLNRQNVLLVLGVVSVAYLICTQTSSHISQEPASNAATKIAKAIVEGDKAMLKRYLSPLERKFGLKDDRSIDAWIDYVQNCLSGYKPTGAPQVTNLAGGDDVECDMELVDREGANPILISVVVYPTPEGPKFFLVASTWSSAFLAKFGKGDYPLTKQRWFALHQAIAQDGAKLNAMGVNGSTALAENGRVQFQSWSDLDALATRALAPSPTRQ